jgi:hypothetical protein
METPPPMDCRGRKHERLGIGSRASIALAKNRL